MSAPFRPPPAPAGRRIGVARALSKRGVASRSAAAAMVLAGRVRLNGRLVRDPETPTVAGDAITVDGLPAEALVRRYLMLNKPRGLVTTASDERGRDTVYRCLDPAEAGWLAPVGRLDKASEGLLLFSNDPEWAQRLLGADSHLEKRYHVQIDRLPDPALLAALRAGCESPVGPLRARAVEVLRAGGRNAWLEFTFDEGRNRQIRRMLDQVDVGVLRLMRVAIGPLVLGDLQKGAARDLTPGELTALARALSGGPGRGPGRVPGRGPGRGPGARGKSHP